MLAKRTYRFGATCTLHEEQLPLRTAPLIDAARQGLFVADVELYPFKPLTDVVVRGHAYAPSGGNRVDIEVAVGDLHRRLLVVGDRRCYRTHAGHVAFSEPGGFSRIPLEYDRAYGGRDRHAEERFPNPLTQLAPHLPSHIDADVYGLGAYPRNRHGRGYLIEASARALESVALPNIEDPDDLLAPERLEAKHPTQWHRMPIPCGTTWLHPGYFARSVYLGAFPFWRALPADLAEFVRGLIPTRVTELAVGTRDPLMMRFVNGASLGLQVPHLKPGTAVTLVHLHASTPRLDVVLPLDHPRIWVDGRNGKLIATDPVIHHIEFEPDEDRVSIVWRGSAPALRPYLPEELETMPFRVEWPEGSG